MSGLNVLDLFSGIGGFSLGLEAAGFETAAFCEVSPKCRHLLKHHWPEVPIYDDVCTLTADRLAADGIVPDVICGGFPCQDISLAGSGAGLSGERSGLWREYARLVRELRPELVVVENVSALLGRGLGDVLGDLASFGYDAWWDCIPAVAVGAPHRRDRLWIVAYARGQQHEGFGDALRRAVAKELHGAPVADPAVQPQREPPTEADTVAVGRKARLVTSRGGELEPDQRRSVDDALRGRHWAQEGQVCAGRHSPIGASWWATEPDVGRVADGVPARVDRLHGLGNAVVPEIPYRLGRAILAARSERLAA